MTQWNPTEHPREDSGRFTRKLHPLTMNDLIRATLAIFPDAVVDEDNGGQLIIYTGLRESGNAIVAFDPDADPDKHAFVSNPDDPESCATCGDNEGANDHLDPDDHAHVWMGVEGLTAHDIDALDDLTDAIADHFDGELNPAAEMVANWIGGFDGETNQYVKDRSSLLADREASLSGLRAFMGDVQADRES